MHLIISDVLGLLRLCFGWSSLDCVENNVNIIMRPSSLGGGRIMRRTLSVRLSVCLSVRPVIVAIGYVFSAPLASRMYFSARTEGIRTFRHVLRAAYRTAISAHRFLFSTRLYNNRQQMWWAIRRLCFRFFFRWCAFVNIAKFMVKSYELQTWCTDRVWWPASSSCAGTLPSTRKLWLALRQSIF